jgi:hypothetical protein
MIAGIRFVRADLQELRVELLALADVHRMDVVGQAHLLERHADLAAVRRVPGVEFDGHGSLPRHENSTRIVTEQRPVRNRHPDRNAGNSPATLVSS